MDVNATLAEIRRLTERIMHEGGNRFDAEELATHVFNLDEWLSGKGGFLPTDWQPKTHPESCTCYGCRQWPEESW